MRTAVKVFIDSNVWFSAFYGSENCEKLIKASIEGKFKAVISQQVLRELVENFKDKLPGALDDFQNFISSYPPILAPDPSEVVFKVKDLTAREDAVIFSAAVTANANYFITGNIKDYKVDRLEKLTGVKILTPRKAVELFKL